MAKQTTPRRTIKTNVTFTEEVDTMLRWLVWKHRMERVAILELLIKEGAKRSGYPNGRPATASEVAAVAAPVRAEPTREDK